MTSLVWIVVGTIIFTAVAGSLGYLLWIKLRPKKITYKARVYVRSEGVLPPMKDSKGNIISDISLQDLKPYARDRVELVENRDGTKVYRLKMLNKPLPPIETDVIDYWGKDDKEVNILLENDCCTLLKKGYDKNSGIVFSPLPHDRLNMVVNQISIRKDRIKEAKSAFEAVAPFIKVTMWILGMVFITWILTNAYMEMTEKITEAQITIAENTDCSALIAQSGTNSNRNVGVQPNPPPSIEGG